MDKKLIGIGAAAAALLIGVAVSMFADLGGKSGLARDGANRALDAATGN